MADLKENFDKQEQGLVEYFKILLKKKKIILFTTLAAGLIAVVMVLFVMKPLFLSTGSVKGSGSGAGLSGLISKAVVPDLGGLENITGAGSSKELATYIEILNSRRCLEETILKFNLIEVYEAKYMEDMVGHFRENIMVTKGNKLAGTLEIGVYDTDPQRAKDITIFLIDELNKIYTELSIQSAKNNREFIEARYNEVKVNLRNTEDSLRKFQDEYGVAPDLVIQSVVQAEIQLEGQIKSEEVKLDILKKILSPDESEIKIQEEKIYALSTQLNDIRNATDGPSTLKLKGSPEKIMNFLRLKRDVEIQNKILTTLIPLFEQSKIEEKKETPTVLVLDQPNFPEKKAKPRRTIVVLMSMFFTFAFLSISFILYETFIKKVVRKLSDKNE